MNHLPASQRGSSPGIPHMQMSANLLEPAAIMSREMETKTVDYTVHTHTSLRDSTRHKKEVSIWERGAVFHTGTFTLLIQ